MKSYDWQNIRGRLAEALTFVPEFARHPLRGMRTLPDWDWPTILILQAGLAAATASLGSLVGRHWVLMVTSLVVAPITYFVVNALVTALFFGLFRVAFKRDVPFRQIWLSAVFASLPGQLLLILAPLVPALSILGALAFARLIYVTFVDTFHLPRRPLRWILGVLFAGYAALTVSSLLNSKAHRTHIKERASPESLDILEREFKSNPPED